MRRFASISVAIMLFMTGVTITTAILPAAPASATTCTAGDIRAGSYNGPLDTDINGEQGNFYVSYQLRNINQAPSAADIYLIDGSDFSQFGWYEGTTEGLPYASTPKPFIGEYDANSPYGEDLTAINYTLTPGSFYYFSFTRNENSSDHNNYGRYFAYINGGLVAESRLVHSGGQPGSNGEVDANCVGMLNDWAQTAPPYPTLQYHRRSTNSWYAWAQQYDFTNDANCYAASRVGGSSGTTYDYNTNNYGCP